MLDRFDELYCWQLLHQVEKGEKPHPHKVPDIFVLGLLLDEERVREILNRRLGSSGYGFSYLSGFHSSDAIEVLGRERIVPRAVIVATDDGLVDRFKLNVTHGNTAQVARTLALMTVKAACGSTRISEALIGGHLALSYCHIRGVHPPQDSPVLDFMTPEVIEIAINVCGKKSDWFAFRGHEYLRSIGAYPNAEALCR